MNDEFDYYLIQSSGKFTPPLLRNDDDIDSSGCTFLMRSELTDINTTRYLTFNSPIPKKPEMTDYLNLECRAVFSKKIYDVLNNLDIKDFQLVHAVVNGKKGEEYKDYWIANIIREYAFLDKDRSKFKSITSTGQWSMIKQMVIDKGLMAEIPLEERLIYVSKESAAYVFYHKTVVDAIMSVNPTGLVFVPVEDWYNGIKYKL